MTWYFTSTDGGNSTAEQEMNDDESFLDSVSTYFAFAVIGLLVLVSCCINFFAWIHKKVDRTYDAVKHWSIMIYGLQLFDLYSDVVFIIFLANKYIDLVNENENSANDTSSDDERTYLILLLTSAIFVVVPWLYNIVFLFWLQGINWMDNVSAASWNRRYRKVLVIATVFSGGIYYSIHLLNSRLFGAKLFSIGLSHRQMLFISQRTVIANAFLENLPQIIIQILYLMISKHGFSLPVTMALVSSSFSFLLALISSIANILDDLHGMFLFCFYL